ncbi:MAG: hypothetical protein KIS89_07540, partial [Dokdonella sp.]|nr:hypothetical protein [Dokdonella sp.]
ASWTSNPGAIGVGTGSTPPGVVPRTLDWGTMYSFTLISTRAPVEGTATLHVATAGTPSQYTVTTLVPGANALQLGK